MLLDFGVIGIPADLTILGLPVVPTPGGRGIITLVAWATLLAVGHQISHSGIHEPQAALTSSALGLGSAGLAFAALLYLVVLSLPFVPAIELGALILALFGQTGVVVAYVATVGGLCLFLLELIDIDPYREVAVVPSFETIAHTVDRET